VAGFFALAATVDVYTSSPDPSQQRRFIGGVTLITADFVVVDDEGYQISDLRPEEVSLKIDGSTRAVRSLQFISMPTPRLGPEGVLAPLPAPYGSNAVSESGRSVIIVVDTESFRPGREIPMREAIGELLDGLSSVDRVALVTVPYGMIRVDLTTDHSQVRASLQTVSGQAPQAPTRMAPPDTPDVPGQRSSSDEACRSRRTLEALTALLNGLPRGEGPNSVLFFSSSLLGPRKDDTRNSFPGACEILNEDFMDVGEAAGSARAQFVVVMPSEVMADPIYAARNVGEVGGSTNPMEGLEFLQAITGAPRLTLANVAERPLDRVIHETSGYYLVSFEPEEGDLNGEHHGMEIGVTRPDVNVRSRSFLAVQEGAAPDIIPTITPLDMLRVPRVFRDLPLRTTGYTSRGVDGRLNVLAIGEAIEPDAALVAASAALFDTSGRLVVQWTAEGTDLGRRSAMAALEAPPGDYRLRFAARDALGRSGTADADLKVGLGQAGMIEMSSIVLGVSRRLGDAEPAFMPKLEFTTEPVAIAYLEIYGATAGASVAGGIEISATEDGPAILVSPISLERTTDADRYQGTGSIAIGALPPGDYVIRITLGLEGGVQGKVSRTLRKAG
jgi:VWFA-related protein